MAETRIAIVGGGLSGLAAAYQASRRFPNSEIVVFEGTARVGGVLRSEQVDGYLIEHSADMFTTEPDDALKLIQELGKENELVSTIPTPDRAYVAMKEGIAPVPRGLSLMLPGNVDEVLSSPLLDEAAKRRFLEEENIPPEDNGKDESLKSFAIRRFGQTVFDHLIQPLASGIYTADPELLSMRATMQRFVDMVQQHGSLIAAGKARSSGQQDSQTSGARYGLFRAPAKGMQQIVDWLVEACQSHGKVSIQYGSQVSQLSSNESHGWQIGGTNPEGSFAESFDKIVLAISAQRCAKLFDGWADSLSTALSGIVAASSAIIILGVESSQLNRDFEGYGIIYPTVLNRDSIALSFASNKFPGRAPEGRKLIRCFMGGALRPELVALDDETLIGNAIHELNRTIGIDGTPELARVYRWHQCMPQYHIGHLERVKTIEQCLTDFPGLEIAGNSYNGVGIPACIKSGRDAVERLAD